MFKYFLFLSMVLFIAGCIYEKPFANPDNSPIDEKLLGCWKYSDNNKDKSSIEMLVMKYSDTEYLVRYVTGDNPLYFKAYNVTVGELKAVQIQWIGMEKGILANENRKYNLLKYKLERDSLEIRFINDLLVPKNITDSEKLRSKVIENSKDAKLFNDPGKFERIKKNEDSSRRQNTVPEGRS